MLNSRREFLVKSAAAVGTMQLARPTEAEDKATPDAILSLFKALPGEVAVKIYAPAVDGKPEFVVQANSAKTMFVGSAIKTFILCEALRQSDTPEVVKTLRARQLNLDASVWALDSAI